jgi:hypothetical protein
MARVDGQRTAIEDAQAQHEVADEVPNLFGGDN